MGTPAVTPPPHDYHDLIRDSASLEGPFRLCPGLRHRQRPAPTPASPHQSYEQLLAAEPLRIRTRDESLSMPDDHKPASLNAIYELLSDGIFKQRNYDDKVEFVNNVQSRPKTITKASAAKKRRAPKLQTFIGGGSGTTHNVAVTRRIRLGQQRLQRCVERSQSALLESLRSDRRRECNDCGVLDCDPHCQSYRYSNGLDSRRIMEDASVNQDLTQATRLKSKARNLLSAYESELREASSKLESPVSGSSAVSSTRADTSIRRSASADLRHLSKNNVSGPAMLGQLPSRSDSHYTPLSFQDHPAGSRISFQEPGHRQGEVLEGTFNGHKPQANAVDEIVHDIAEFVLNPDSHNGASKPPSFDPINQQDSINEDHNEPIKSDQLRCESLRRIRESLQSSRGRQHVMERQLLKSIHDLYDLTHANTTVIARLRHDPALTAKKRLTLQQAKSKVKLSKNMIVQLTAKIFLLRLRHDASLAKQRRLLIDRLSSRWPTISLRLILRTWASHAAQYSAPLRPLVQRASHLTEQVRSRIRRHFMLIWLLRARHLTLCQGLIDAAVTIATASPFFKWRSLTLRCQRLKASIAGQLLSRALPSFSDMMKTYRLRCRAQIQHLIGIDDASAPTIPASESEASDDRMGELAATLHDRKLRRIAYCRWTCALHQCRRQHHLDMLGQWHLVRRTLLRWRHRTSQVRDFIINSDERRCEDLLASSFRHWALMFDERRKTCEIIRNTVYPHRLLKRTMIRWRRIASVLRSHADLYEAMLNQQRRRYFHYWKLRLLARQRFRNVLGRIETLHLQMQFRRQWTRWRDRIRHMCLVRRVFRDAISRWTARLETSKVSPIKAFSAWLRFIDSQRLKRIRRVQASTAALYDDIRIRIWALKRWRYAYQLRVVFRSWRTSTKERVRERNRFLLKWRYLVPISKAFRALRANVSVAKKAEALAWKAHYL